MMTTLTLDISEYEKQALKEQAASAGKSIQAFILESLGINAKKQGTINDAIRDLDIGNTLQYKTIDDFIADTKTW